VGRTTHLTKVCGIGRQHALPSGHAIALMNQMLSSDVRSRRAHGFRAPCRVDVAASSGTRRVQGSRARLALMLSILIAGVAQARDARGASSAPDARSPKDSHPRVNEEEEEEEEEEADFTLGAETDLNARYIWRGQALSTGPVIQPSAWFTAYGLNAVLWTNVMLTNEAPRRLSAVVPAVSYTFEWKSLTIEPGLLYYDTPGQQFPPHTAEASLESSLAIGTLRLLTTDYVDIAHTPGAYYGTLGASWEPKRGRWSFKALADVGWATAPFNQVYFDSHVAALDVADLAGKAQYALSDELYVALHAEGSTLLTASLAVDKPATLGNVGILFGGELGL
jgi:hypothetical protein